MVNLVSNSKGPLHTQALYGCADIQQVHHDHLGLLSLARICFPVGVVPELLALIALSLIASYPASFNRCPENSGEASSRDIQAHREGYLLQGFGFSFVIGKDSQHDLGVHGIISWML